MSRLFHTYGKFCASHPWEVMVSFLTLSICLFSMGGSWGSAKLGESTLKDTCSTTSTCSDVSLDFDDRSMIWRQHYSFCLICVGNRRQDEHSDAVYIITVVRCLCLLYIYHQFRKLYKLGSKYLAGIAGLFTVFSSFIFCSGVINFLNGGFSELK